MFRSLFVSLSRPSPSPVRPALLVLTLAWIALPLVSCGPAPPAEEASGASDEVVVATGLGVQLAGVPAGFEVVAEPDGEGDALVLEATGAEQDGRIEITASPVRDAGINLHDEVWSDKDRIEALPEGRYFGQNEIGGSPLGTAFASRGRYLDAEGQRLEERRVLSLHPTANRVLYLSYVYTPQPGEESSGRLQDLFAVMERLEPIGGSGDGEAGEGG